MEELKMPVSGFHRFPSFGGLSRALITGLLFLSTQMCAFGQTELATVLGRVTDPSGAVVAGAQVEIRNVDTNLAVMSGTNGDGLYTIPSLHPGHYVISVRKAGFKTVSVTQLDLNVQDNVVRNFALQVGSSSESVTVTAEGEKINTTDGSVSTVVDRNFAENLPMNGRSFQTLIQLTPGVALTVSNTSDNGQFSINGQRASANYWMVDGVGANIGIGSDNSSAAGNGLGGASASFSVLGGTNSLVSVDAMQEFRIQTSTYAPEFGRTPGGQISIITRSGTNQYHGSVFDYLRNDFFDASDWFNGYINNPPLPKAKERQNDFGGTFSGPLLKDRTFFFFSYEGLRLRLPRTTLSTVPDLNARKNAIPAMQPFLNAFPLPDGVDNPTTGAAEFSATYSEPATLDAYSLRVDHRLSNTLSLFARYAYSPSGLLQRGNGFALSTIFSSRVVTQTATLGTTWMISPALVNDLRFNYSRTSNNTHSFLDNFGGAVPLATLPLPSPFTAQDGQLFLFVRSVGEVEVGLSGVNVQRQINVVDSLSTQKGAHSLKFGIDFRRLSPVYGNPGYRQDIVFRDESSFANGNPFLSFLISTHSRVPFVLHNLGVFAQDTWRATARLTLTYGLRWDIDFAPSSTPQILAVTGFNLQDLSRLALAPRGSPLFKTTYGDIAPRLGLAYQLNQNQGWQTVIRGGVGAFYDLATSELGNNMTPTGYPIGSDSVIFGGNYPLDPSDAAPPPITAAGLSSGNLFSFDPNLKLPYTLQWNAALEQSIGKQQTITVSYIGAVGRRLIQTFQLEQPNANFGAADLVTNAATSDYHALQLQFQKRLSHGLQLLSSYTWSHSIDTASAGSLSGNAANDLIPSVNPNQNRGPSDFDIRHAFSAGITYDIPAPLSEPVARTILRGWSTNVIVQARSAPPVTLFDGNIFNSATGAALLARPDVVTGEGFYLSGAQCASAFQSLGQLPAGGSCPGGRGFNPAAFVSPPTDSNGNALREGNLGRNALRGFGASQLDLAVRREFLIHESLKLQFRAEMFNALNHPNFAPPIQDISNTSQFGLSTQTLGEYLTGGSVGNGGFSPLYQIGGPRSIQLALKLMF
jgi:hypothetical protein